MGVKHVVWRGTMQCICIRFYLILPVSLNAIVGPYGAVCEDHSSSQHISYLGNIELESLFLQVEGSCKRRLLGGLFNRCFRQSEWHVCLMDPGLWTPFITYILEKKGFSNRDMIIFFF